MKIVNIIWRKPVSTYAISACEAFVASVNSVNNSEKTEGNEPTFRVRSCRGRQNKQAYTVAFLLLNSSNEFTTKLQETAQPRVFTKLWGSVSESVTAHKNLGLFQKLSPGGWTVGGNGFLSRGNGGVKKIAAAPLRIISGTTLNGALPPDNWPSYILITIFTPGKKSRNA